MKGSALSSDSVGGQKLAMVTVEASQDTEFFTSGELCSGYGLEMAVLLVLMLRGDVGLGHRALF